MLRNIVLRPRHQLLNLFNRFQKLNVGPTAASFSTVSRKKTVEMLEESKVRGKNVFVRTDFNVPLDKTTGGVSDDTRIRAAIPTIKLLRDKGAKVILCSHMGRPKKITDSLRLTCVSALLPAMLGCPVQQAPDCIGQETKDMIDSMGEGDVIMLDNVRFHEGETKNDPEFSKKLVETTSADIYVNDAFGCAHRAHSSTAGVVEFIDGPKVAGLLLKKEVDYLSGVVNNPKRPFAAIVGGAKVSTKIAVLEALVEKSDKVIIGGAMMFTFLKARGLNVGGSMVEDDSLDLAREVVALAAKKNVPLYIAEDVVIAKKFAEDAEFKVVSVEEIPDGWVGLDIGPKSIAAIQQLLSDCKTVVWNGPMGVFEWKNFQNGTFSVARAMGDATTRGAITIVGGGDSVAAVEHCGVADKISHISTGGGASLELLEGLVLPGVAVLDNADK